MSVEFTLTGSSLDEDGWDELIDAWAGDRELLDEATFVQGQAFLLAEGSIRGVLLTQRDGGLDVRLSALASRADWRMAYAFVRAALERGGGTFTREDGQVLSADALTPDAADEAAVKDFVFAAQVVSQQLDQGGGPQLPLGKFALSLHPGDVPSPCRAEDVPGVEERLSARVARYGVAFSAATMVLGVEGKQVRLTTWARIPTLIAANADCVAVQGLDEPVPLPVVLEVLGDRAERLGERVYLPGLDDAQDGEVIGKLRGASMSVEQFVATHGDRLEAARERGTGDGPEHVAGLDADVQRAARAVAQCLVGGGDLKEARRELIREGAQKDTVDATFAAAGMMLQMIQEEGGFNEAAAQRITSSEIPAFVRDAVLAELARAAGGRKRPFPLLGCGCLLLLVGLIAWGVAAAFG